MKIAKKIVSMCLALALVVTTFAVNTVDVKAEEVNCSVTLEDNYSDSEGIIRGTVSFQKAGNYETICCYNGTEGPYRTGSFGVEEDGVSTGTFTLKIPEYFAELSNGQQAQITVKVYVGDEVVATSNAITITLANERLNAPTGVVINGNTVTWDAVEGASQYKISHTIKKADGSYGGDSRSDKYVTGCSYNLSNAPEGTVKIKINSCSADYSKKLDSNDYTSYSITGTDNPTTPSNPTPPTDGGNESANEKDNEADDGVIDLTDEDIAFIKKAEIEARQKKAVKGADGKEVKTEIDGVYEVSNLEGTAVKTPKADVAKAVGLTEEEILNGTNTSIYMSDGLSKEAKDTLKEAANSNGKKVLSMFMADMYKINKAGEVVKTNTLKENVEMLIGIPENGVDANKTYSVLCVTPDGQTIEFKDMDNDPKTITVNANVFGNWVVVY